MCAKQFVDRLKSLFGGADRPDSNDSDVEQSSASESRSPESSNATNDSYNAGNKKDSQRSKKGPEE